MKEYFEMLKQRGADNPSNYGDADSVLGLENLLDRLE